MKAVLGGVLAVVLACSAVGVCAEPAAAPVEAPLPTLDEAAGKVFKKITDLVIARGAGISFVVASPPGDSLLDAYVTMAVRMYGRRTARFGPLRQTPLLPWPRGTAGPDRLDPRIVARLKGVFDARAERSLLFRCHVETQADGRRRLHVAGYDAGTGRRLLHEATAFRLPESHAFLGTAERVPLPTTERLWLQVFERMFAGGAHPDDALPPEARFLFDSGLWAEAVKRIPVPPKPQADGMLMYRVAALQLAGLAEEAEAVVLAAIKQRPDFGPLYALRSWLRLRADAATDALALLEQARRSDLPHEAYYVYAHGLLSAERKDFKTAEKDFEAAGKLGGGIGALAQLQRARSLRNRGELEEAVRVYAAAPARQADTERAMVLLALGRMDEAVAIQSAILKKYGPDDPVLVRDLVAILRLSGKDCDALEILRKAINRMPFQSGLHEALADCAGDLWMLDQAEASWREALRQQPGRTAVAVQLARVLRRSSRFIEADALLGKLPADDPTVRLERAQLLADVGHTEAAHAALAALAKEPDSLIEARLAAAEICLAGKAPGRGETAVLHVQKALAAGESAEGFALLARAFLTIGRSDAALQAAERGLKMAPGATCARLNLARALDAQGKSEQARKEALAAVESDPFSPEALTLAGTLAAADGESARAAELWRQALALDRWDAELHERLARLLGESPEAATHTEAAHKLHEAARRAAEKIKPPVE
jgi:tetratricopeptide (TPR) repeat protein